MRVSRLRQLWVCLTALLIPFGAAEARLSYNVEPLDGGVRLLVVAGQFTPDDDVSELLRIITSGSPTAVTFNSTGGNPYKAMQIGRLIRMAQLPTIQIRGMECASACALAFIGGTDRYAEAGSIGVHQSTFSDTTGLTTGEAVGAIQAATADIIAYLVEMGVDPALLQLALKYDSTDIRFLSKSEMVEYRIIPPDNVARIPEAAISPNAAHSSLETTPSVARSGRIRHPEGSAPLQPSADEKAAAIATLSNGIRLTITEDIGRWYKVIANGNTGYVHHTWVYVDQFESGPFAERHVQIKSFKSEGEAEAFLRSTDVPVAVYLATNGWLAVTLADTFPQDIALDLTRKLKADGRIPADSFITYGNTYVRKLCCE